MFDKYWNIYKNTSRRDASKNGDGYFNVHGPGGDRVVEIPAYF